MSAFENIDDMYDVALKPRLLRTLLSEHLPDEEHLFRNTSELLYVVSVVKTHDLLSENAADCTDDKQMKVWKSAVDAWVSRLLLLVSGDVPDKCWAGIFLLGMTCEGCSSERFLASYSMWFNKILSHFLSPAESNLVKVAACDSMSNLFTRLGGFPNMKKNEASHATKLIQPLLKLMEDGSDDLLEVAIRLLCTIINFFQSSIRQHYNSVEAAVVSKIMSGKYDRKMLQKLAHCLALLPTSREDADCWSLMMRKILVAINILLNDAFQGLEEASKSKEVMRMLVPPGKDPPPPLGGLTLLQTSDQAIKRPAQLLMRDASALILCCCTLLTSPYRVPNALVRTLIMLVRRTLAVDGSLPPAFFPFTTAMQQEAVCSELPALHSSSLELLGEVIKKVRSEFTPYALDLVGFMTQFRRRVKQELRVKVYSIIKLLLMTCGMVMPAQLAKEVINGTFEDLDCSSTGVAEARSNMLLKSSFEALPKPKQKKRKHETTTFVSPKEQPVSACLLRTCAMLPVKIAALQTVETLLTVGLKPGRWQTNVDRLLMTVAIDACEGGWAKDEENVFHPTEPDSTWADFQLAALRALLASHLSSALLPPSYLRRGLELFERGKLEMGTKVSEFCAHAMLTLNAAGNPCAPYASSKTVDSFDGSRNRVPENNYSRVQKENPFPVDEYRNEPDDSDSEDDELYEIWTRNNGKVKVKNTTDAGPPREVEKITAIPESNKDRAAAASAINLMDREGKENHFLKDLDAQQSIEEKEKYFVKNLEAQLPATQSVDTAGLEGQTIHLSSTAESESRKSSAMDTMDMNMTIRACSTTVDEEKVPGHAKLGTKGDGLPKEEDSTITAGSNMGDGEVKGDGLAKIGGRTYAKITSSSGSREFVFVIDNEPSMDEFPDIVDVEPESDEN